MSRTPAVRRETVRWGYRLVLGREPEAERVLADWVASGDFHALREGLLGSEEFTGLAASGFPERGGWVHGPVTEEAVEILLALRDGQAPAPEEVARCRAATPDLRALRRLLLDGPEVARRLPCRGGPVARPFEAAGRLLILRAAESDPGMAGFPGMGPRLGALLRAAFPDGGQGRVLLDDGAGIGLSLLGMAAGAPDHAALVGFEPGLRAAALLAGAIADNGLARARAQAVPLEDPQRVLDAAGLDRLDVLRLGGPDAGRKLEAWSGWLAERKVLVVVRLELAALLADPDDHPRAALRRWRSLMPHMAGFDAEGIPYAVTGEAEASRALAIALARPDRADELVLSADLGWMERYAPD